MNEELNQQPVNTGESNVSHETVLSNLAEVEAQETAATNEEIILDENANEEHANDENASEKIDENDSENAENAKINAEKRRL